MTPRRLFLWVLVWVWLAPPLRAEVEPHPIFSDHMVLQQGTPLRVWGKAKPGEKITVRLEREGQPVATAMATADDKGRWSVELPAQKAGTGFTLTVQGQNTVTFKNVAVGEVWICSG
ncbi:MAG: hypothetical protein WHU94_10525, partial [Thermogemmata sp.]